MSALRTRLRHFKQRHPKLITSMGMCSRGIGLLNQWGLEGCLSLLDISPLITRRRAVREWTLSRRKWITLSQRGSKFLSWLWRILRVLEGLLFGLKFNEKAFFLRDQVNRWGISGRRMLWKVLRSISAAQSKMRRGTVMHSRLFQLFRSGIWPPLDLNKMLRINSLRLQKYHSMCTLVLVLTKYHQAHL